VDRGKKGSKLHVLSEAGGLPLAVAVPAANTAGIEALPPLVRAIPAVRSRRGPRRRRPGKARAGKGYDPAGLRRWLRGRGITPRIARRGIESSERPGRHRWKTGRTIAWLSGYRRLAIRYERHAHLFTAFLTLAAALTAICVRGTHRQLIAICDLPLPAPPPPGSEWITAYGHWAGRR
jgi:transposase